MSHTPLENTPGPADADDSAADELSAAQRAESPQTSHVEPPVSPSGTAWARVRPLLLRLHFYAGVFVGPFILVAAITGLMYALIPQIDAWTTRDERTVAAVGERVMPLSEQLAAVRAAHPEGTVSSIRPPANDSESTRVTLAVDDVPPDYARTVFVDPYTGEIRGALTTFGEWMPLRAWFDELHRNLHLGVVGRSYSELAASWLWVIALAGLALWIGHRKTTGTLRRVFVPDRDAKGRRRLLSWHGAIGVWVIVGLLGLSVTGMTWSRFAGESIETLQRHLVSTPPAVNTSLAIAAEGGEPASGGGHHSAEEPVAAEISEQDAMRGIDVALRAARDAGLGNPLTMYPPATAEEGWLVSENKRDWPTRYDSVSVDPDTGAITDRVNFSEWPVLAKLTDWGIGAHMGILFGIVNQIVLAMIALGLISGVLLGYRMWWRRRPTRGGPPVGPRRGALAGLKPAESVMFVLVVVVVGWFVPLFGVSLAVFVAVDVAFGWWKCRQATAGAQAR